jgi:hypothetical protein
MIGIIYPSGSHGMFLEMLLNLFSGIEIESNPISTSVHTYDHISYKQLHIFKATHSKNYLPPCNNWINISVNPSSYMKYAAVGFNRTSGLNIALEELNHNTFNKIKDHAIFSQLLSSLTTISGLESGDVEVKYLREWARLCFFKGTIKKWLATSVDPAADYILDFECFYDDDNLLEQCKLILNKFNLPIHPIKNIQEYLTAFKQNNRYRNIDVDIKLITQAIINKQDYKFNSENFIKQAWIDHWLEITYNVNIKLKNEYWNNTKEIIEAYDL